MDGLRGIDADVVALQELGPDHAAAIEADPELRTRFPYRELAPREGVEGMGLLSAYPIVRSALLTDPMAIEAVLDVDGRPVTVISGHPFPGRIRVAGPLPVSFDPSARDQSLVRFRARVDAAIARGETVIVAGDFNTAPTEPAFEQLVAGLADAHAEVGLGPGWTWRPSRLEGLGLGVLRIDLALSGPGARPIAVGERCDLPGDHCRLEARFALDLTRADETRGAEAKSGPAKLHERDGRHRQVEREMRDPVQPTETCSSGRSDSRRSAARSRSHWPAVGQSPPPIPSQVRAMFECVSSTRRCSTRYSRGEPRDVQRHLAAERVVARGLGLVECAVPECDGDASPSTCIPARPRLDKAAAAVAGDPAGQLVLAQLLQERDGPEPRLAQPADREQAEPAMEELLGYAELHELVRGDPIRQRLDRPAAERIPRATSGAPQTLSFTGPPWVGLTPHSVHQIGMSVRPYRSRIGRRSSGGAP